MKQLLKKILPRRVTASLKNFLAFADEKLIKLFAKNGFLASFYYFAFSRLFDREHKSVLAGRLAYKLSLSKIGQSSILLRRNVHRLEKGLIMRPRRAVFARDYIKETVENYILCVQSKTLCGEELKWATDVLKEYFAVVEDEPVITAAKKSFNNVLIANERVQLHSGIEKPGHKGCYSPYPYSDLPPSDINYQQLHSLYLRRRSVRWYEDRLVEIEKVHQAINAASLAPSACNRQPYRFHLEVEPSKAIQIATCAMGTAGFAQNLQAIIVVLGDLSAYPKERDRHVIYIDSGLASMQLMLALETLGLSSCPINWPDIEKNERKLAKILDLKVYERPVMLMAVGYAHPDGGIPFSQKKNASVLLRNYETEM